MMHFGKQLFNKNAYAYAAVVVSITDCSRREAQMANVN